MAMRGDERCDGCIFWKHAHWLQNDEGLCRRHPPIAYANADHDSCTAWPETGADDFCGDYEAKPVNKKAKK